MKTNQTYATAIVFACLVLLAIVPHAQEQAGPLRLALGDQQYMQCGLDKLTATEQEALVRIVATGPTASYTQSAAEKYMEKLGWRKIRVLGARNASADNDELQIVVWDRYQLFLLDPFIVPYLPEPGTYWAKNTVSAWTLLYADAKEGSFSAREISGR